MRKKRKDQKCGPGKRDRALGYAINARPGPARQKKTFYVHSTAVLYET